MSKIVRIVALVMAILMGLSAIGMIAVYISAADYCDGASFSASAREIDTAIESGASAIKAVFTDRVNFL